MTGLLFVLSFTASPVAASRLLAELAWLLEDYRPSARA
jgi:hypothetical protein